MIGMQCPDCGYEVVDTAVFCPRCRFQFRENEDSPAVDTAIPETPARNVEIDESFFEERPNPFSDKELRLLEVHLISPAVIVVLIISLFTYSLVMTVPFIPLTIAGLSFGITGMICLTCGLVAGILFFFFARRSLVKFRYR